ncbi:hypothetical protein MPSEU_000074900 [Mayamaea pseudoterrestris]|nr:hypothetical protein MPSEU_000074900 [Mayamaea pseudoterrestris]
MSRRSGRPQDRNNKIHAISSVVETLCRQQLAIAGSTTDSDMSWMDEQLQLFQSRARACAGAAVVSYSSAADFAGRTATSDWETEEARIDTLLVKHLKAELARAGLCCDGKKCILQARLKEFLYPQFQPQSISSSEEDMAMDVEHGNDGEEAFNAAGVKEPTGDKNVLGPRTDLSPVEEADSPTDGPDSHGLAPQSKSQSTCGADAAGELDTDQYMGASVAAAKMSVDVMEDDAPKANKASKMSIDEPEKIAGPDVVDNDAKMSTDDVAHLSPKKFEAGTDENLNLSHLGASPGPSVPKIQSMSPVVPSSCDRKRSRSPLGMVQSALQIRSPNCSQTKVQKKYPWPMSQSKQRKSSGDIDMVDAQDLSATFAVQPPVARLYPSASPYNFASATTASVAPRAFQAALSTNKVVPVGFMAPSNADGGTSVLKGDARKKNEDRKARINNKIRVNGRTDEIRAMSKPVPPTKPLLPTISHTQIFTTVKSAGKTNPPAATEMNTTKMLQQQMREKAMNGSNLNWGQTMASGVASSAATKTTSVKAAGVAGVHKTQMTESLKKDSNFSPTQSVPSKQPTLHKKIVQTSPVRAMSSQKPTPASPFDTYEMSDGENHTVDSEDEEEREKKAKKYIPNWARPLNLKVILEKQHKRTDDPDDTFFRVTTCDLDAIFGTLSHKSYSHRNSTGDWGDDHRPHENLVPKRAVGY